MSGQSTYKPNVLSRLNRKAFLLRAGIGVTAAIAGAYLFKKARAKNTVHIKGKIVGANAKAGHFLRDKLAIPAPETIEQVDYIIIGGGVSGLSAARELKRQGITNFKVLELDHHAGGNSSNGKNEVSAYPWGAHYLPIPDPNDKELITFLQETESIIGFDDKGLPYFNEYHLCFDPEERLYIRGQWQEGLIPSVGLSVSDKKEIERFLKLVENYRSAKGSDGKFAFSIPISNSSQDSIYTNLDRISFASFLEKEGFKSAYLLWYLNYACKDDFGSTIHETSAWAGIHYFAGRKGKAANAKNGDLLTWPEGNAFLANHLKEQVSEHIETNSLVYQLAFESDKVAVQIFDPVLNKSRVIKAKKVLSACPQFVNQRLLASIKSDRTTEIYEQFNYAPWMISNITINQLPPSAGIGLCWDNVMYDSESVGYVNANHQHTIQGETKRVLTYYLPITGKEPRLQRLAAFTRSYDEWLSMICEDLEKSHQGITPFIEQVDIWLWGHGMIRPQPGFIWGEAKKKAANPINNCLFFAHSDLSGVSIFEEAFHQGINSARNMIASF